MGLEPPVRGELAGADLELQCRGSTAADTALAYVGRTLGEGPDRRERSRPGGTNAPGLAMPFDIEDVGVGVVGVGTGQRKSWVLLTPCFDVR